MEISQTEKFLRGCNRTKNLASKYKDDPEAVEAWKDQQDECVRQRGEQGVRNWQNTFFSYFARFQERFHEELGRSWLQLPAHQILSSMGEETGGLKSIPLLIKHIVQSNQFIC